MINNKVKDSMIKKEDKEINSTNMLLRLLFYSEVFIFFVAILIIIIFGILLYIYFPTDAEVAQGIFTGFMAWIGAIVGFYFGQKPVRDVLTRLQEREKQNIQNVDLAEQEIENYHKQLSEIKKDLLELMG